MSFNTDALTLLALGIQDDQPPEGSGQPPLVTAIHLRWSFAQELGFPWYGFYLFRRASRPRRPRCLSLVLVGLRPGSSASTSLQTRLGRLVSPRPLLFTESFPAPDVVEVDLAGGVRFELPEGVEAGSIEVRIGFRDAGPTVQRTCIDFRRFPPGVGLSPRTEHAVVFETAPPQISPPISETVIERWPGSPVGLNSSRRLEITLPRVASRIDLIVTNRLPVRIEALAGDGHQVARRDLARGELQAGTVSLSGTGITRVILDSAGADGALLHEICFEAPAGGPRESRIGVRAVSHTQVVAEKMVSGFAGQVVSATLEAGGITAVEIDPGPAALVDLCYLPVRQGVVHGWEEIPGFTYPLCLPVDHVDYPCPRKPASFDEAKALALSRVTYPGPPGWEDGFADLHGQLEILVQGGPSGGPMAERKNPDLPGEPESPATQPELPKMPGLRPLALILLASLHPTIAQMVGLYFADQTVEPGVGYDYLLLADSTGVLGGGAGSALEWLVFTADASKLDAVIIFDRKAEPRLPIPPPGKPRAYALPGGTTRLWNGDLAEGQGNVGLDWDAPADSVGEEDLDRIIFYYLKRAYLGLSRPDPGSPLPDASQYQALDDLSPVLLARPLHPEPDHQRSPEWPPPPTSFRVLDSNRPEGWYSYGLVGQNLFGRRSVLGPPAEWLQWVLPPGVEPPWYYKPSGSGVVHPWAVAILDKIAPSPPAIEAWALDPLDRWVWQDDAYIAWRTDHPDLVGLRVRWRWTLMQQLQAPDLREFRLYYQPGRPNALLGRTVTVTPASASQSDVETDLADGHPSGAFTGARLRVGNDSFEILGSQPGAALRLRAKNIGVHDEVRPAAGKPCTIAIPEGHPLFTDFSRPAAWAQRLWVEDQAHAVRWVIEPSNDPADKPLTDATFSGAKATVSADVAQLPVAADLSGVQPWLDHLWLEEDTARPTKTYRIITIDAAHRRVTLDGTPSLAASASAWIIGRPAREYEVFLPAPDIGPGQVFEPSPAEPSVYAQIAVSAADIRTHTDDHPKWTGQTWGGRYGNEGRTGAAATIFRVLQKPPNPPELPDYPEKLMATAADYHSRSFLTFRWKPVEHLRAHILRALDDSLFQRDWQIRETRKKLDPTKADHLDFFPDGWSETRRTEAADIVNALVNETDYAALSSDAWDVLALLPGNEGIGGGPGLAATEKDRRRSALKKQDLAVRHTRKSLAAADDAWFPANWDGTRRQNAADKLNALADPKDYPKLPDNALRILGGLPGNDGAFTQLTLDPLDMADLALQDHRGPDDPTNYAIDTSLRAWQDTLPGCGSANRYFYRALFVDGAQNRSGLSLATPPVYLPNINAPRAPVVTKVVGGDRQITIQWASNREEDLAEYRVYRTLDGEGQIDIRRMQLLHTEVVANVPPTKRPLTYSFLDDSVPGQMTVYYRLVAHNLTGNSSAPSRPVAARAYDLGTPTPVDILDVVWIDAGVETEIEATWNPINDVDVQLLRKSEGAARWVATSRWVRGDTGRLRDASAEPWLSHELTLRTRSRSGNIAESTVVLDLGRLTN